MNWPKIKIAFYVFSATWVLSGIFFYLALRSARGSAYYTLLDVRVFFVDIPGLIAIVLGLMLFFRWISLKLRFRGDTGGYKAAVLENRIDSQPRKPEAQKPDRWDALIRFDEEIRAANEKLRPYGQETLQEFREAFFALDEDRAYLPKIIERLQIEGEQKLAQRWTDQFRFTVGRDELSKESLNILQKAESIGYTLGRESDGTIVVTKNGANSFLRSNSDIKRFGSYM